MAESLLNESAAAAALKPLAGSACSIFFSLGIIGNGLLAVPVLAGSAAFAIGEAFQWPTGLQKKFLEAPGFYLIMIFSTLIGLALVFLRVNPIRMLVVTALINGIISAPILIPTFLMAFDPKVMGSIRLPLRIKIIGVFAVIVALSILGLYLLAETFF